ncbi:MAG: hypothetical protein HYX27_02705 [Acidobacteria bacterium]|nr:hypothetical protein [Acidobacteriota bacterium]
MSTSRLKLVLVIAVAAMGAALWLGTAGVQAAGSDHVSWDIINLSFGPPVVFSAGGSAFATAANPNTLRIKLTGAGTFVAPASGGHSNAATGGGTWETFNGAISTGSGSYWVTGLTTWQFANFQAAGIIDSIGPVGTAANGSAILRIHYSDGSEGVLGIGCHGPGAPAGIVEGVIATKDVVTYWNANPPLPGVNLNRTVFHILK